MCLMTTSPSLAEPMRVSLSGLCGWAWKRGSVRRRWMRIETVVLCRLREHGSWQAWANCMKFQTKWDSLASLRNDVSEVNNLEGEERRADPSERQRWGTLYPSERKATISFIQSFASLSLSISGYYVAWLFLFPKR